MNTVGLLQYSLDFAFDILGQVTADLTQEQIDWRPPGIAPTIGSIYSHILTYVDLFIKDACIEQKPFPESIDSRPAVLYLQDVQVELSALHKRAGEVQRTAQDWLSSLTPADLARKRDTTIGELNQGQMLEAYIVWHINVHCGEIAALKGCQGAKGYPW
jgi:uncharacterized damage-inducible protein DinB